MITKSSKTKQEIWTLVVQMFMTTHGQHLDDKVSLLGNLWTIFRTHLDVDNRPNVYIGESANSMRQNYRVIVLQEILFHLLPKISLRIFSTSQLFFGVYIFFCI